MQIATAFVMGSVFAMAMRVVISRLVEMALQVDAYSDAVETARMRLGMLRDSRVGKAIEREFGVPGMPVDRNSTPQTSLFKEGPRRTHFWNVK